MNMLPSRWPGEVVSYDTARRVCRVRIPGITDGSTEFPEATIEQPIGDKSEHTEIRILPGDRVWLAFECSDVRFPIVTGFRAKETGNETAYRRFHHANIELTADGVLRLNAATIEINGATTINGATAINGSVATVGTLTNNTKAVGSTHKHLVIAVGVDTAVPT